MIKYIIKNNLPEKDRPIHLNTDCSMYPAEARKTFLKIADWLSDFYPTKTVFRNENYKTLRGTIQVEIDGFFYYVELFKEL